MFLNLMLVFMCVMCLGLDYAASSTLSTEEMDALEHLHASTNGMNWNYKYPLNVYGYK